MGLRKLSNGEGSYPKIPQWTLCIAPVWDLIETCYFRVDHTWNPCTPPIPPSPFLVFRKFFRTFTPNFSLTFSRKFLAGLWSRERSELLPAQQTRSLFSRCKASARPLSSLRSLHSWPADPWTSGNFVNLIPLETFTSPSVPLRDQIQTLTIGLNLNKILFHGEN